VQTFSRAPPRVESKTSVRKKINRKISKMMLQEFLE